MTRIAPILWALAVAALMCSTLLMPIASEMRWPG